MAPIKTFQEFCKQFSKHDLPDVVKIGRRYFYDPQGLRAFAMERKWELFSVGLFLGEERTFFKPTSALIDLLSEGQDRVVVNEKAAWLFLCGRDILMDGVRDQGESAEDAVVIVCDTQNRVLGYGKILNAFNSKYRNKTFVKHALDRGEYLRRER